MGDELPVLSQDITNICCSPKDDEHPVLSWEVTNSCCYHRWWTSSIRGSDKQLLLSWVTNIQCYGNWWTSAVTMVMNIKWYHGKWQTSAVNMGDEHPVLSWDVTNIYCYHGWWTCSAMMGWQTSAVTTGSDKNQVTTGSDKHPFLLCVNTEKEKTQKWIVNWLIKFISTERSSNPMWTWAGGGIKRLFLF